MMAGIIVLGIYPQPVVNALRPTAMAVSSAR
jgi:NADH:ubiquinone oxidoreductase subunit 4 (subunit M)